MKLEVFEIGNQQHDFLRLRNEAMRNSSADLVMLLNSDIRVSNYDQAVEHFKDPLLFAVTFSPRSSGTGVTKRVEFANGGSSIYNRKIWNEIGGIDMRFAPYWFDDLDYSLRAKKSGYHILEDGNIQVEQISEMGADRIKKSLHGKLIYWRNYFLYHKKNQLGLARRIKYNPIFWPFMIWAELRLRRGQDE